MRYEFNPGKDALNVAKHGLSLGDFAGFDTDPAIIVDFGSSMEKPASSRSVGSMVSAAAWCSR